MDIYTVGEPVLRANALVCAPKSKRGMIALSLLALVRVTVPLQTETGYRINKQEIR